LYVQQTVQISQAEYMGFLSMQNRLDELEFLNLSLKARLDQLLKLVYGAKSERHIGQADISQ